MRFKTVQWKGDESCSLCTICSVSYLEFIFLLDIFLVVMLSIVNNSAVNCASSVHIFIDLYSVEHIR